MPQANKFISSPAGRFPAPQFVRRLSCVVRGTGFALLGDAAHAFPPDLGQGVNSALEDVSVLLDALRGQGTALNRSDLSQEVGAVPPGGGIDGVALAQALKVYQRERAPAAEALARIVQARRRPACHHPSPA
jgi:2-polyprenyl-6-methoxyphenol hydroxylase-like FAD-dependent oxidoreductase